MQLRMKSSDSQVYSDALLELNASSIEYAVRHQLHKLLNHHLYHDEFQSTSENDDDNEVAVAV